MKVQYLVDFAGPRVDIRTGDIREVQAAEANRLIGAGYASPYFEEPELDECAAIDTASRETPQRRKRKHGRS